MHAAPGVHWVLLQSAQGGSSLDDVTTVGDDKAHPAAPRGGAAEAPAAAAVTPSPPRAVEESRLRYCQVPGCGSAPQEARTYVGRCRLCVPHMRADTVQLGAELFRFCQKCGAAATGSVLGPPSIRVSACRLTRVRRRCNRLQTLRDFAGAKRTCTARLESHNERRRTTRDTAPHHRSAPHDTPRRPQRRAAQAAALARAARAAGEPAAPRASPCAGSDGGSCHLLAPPPWGLSRPGDPACSLEDALLDDLFDIGDWLSLEPCAGGDELGRTPGCAEAATAAFAGAWPPLAPAAAQHAELSSPPCAAAAAAAEAADEAALFAACAAAAAAAASAQLSVRTVHVKLPQHAHAAAAAAPGEALYRHEDALRAALPQLHLPHALAHLFAPPAGGAAPLAALGAAVRPGCTLVTLTALLEPRAAPPPAAHLLRRALAAPGAAGAFLRAQSELLVADGAGGEARYSRSSDHAQEPKEPEESRAEVALAPQAPPLAPLAVLCSRDAALTLQAPAAAGVTLHCRLASGRVLPLAACAGGARLQLPRCDEAGVALFEAVPAGTPLHRAGPPRPVLLTWHAAIAAEVAASGDALHALRAGGDVARAHVERCVVALGYALAPGATPPAVAAAAAAALWMGWPAALAELLRAPALSDGSAAANARLVALLCHAAAAPRPAVTLRLLLAGSPMLRRGGALAAALLAQARQDGHAHPPFAAATALDVLSARSGAAAHAAAEAADAAAQLLRAAADAADAADARYNALLPRSDDRRSGGAAIAPTLTATAPQAEDANVHAFRSTALLMLLLYAWCVCMHALRSHEPPLPASLIRAAMPCPEWRLWLRMPTALCCSGARGPVVVAREAVLATVLLLAFAPGQLARRVRARHCSALHVGATAYLIVVEPALCALTTHALFGTAIRQPWQGGVKQLLFTLVAHLASEQRLPPRAHVALMALRGALPLAVRGAQAQGPQAPPPLRLLAALRALPQHAGWDALHAMLAAACVAHCAAVRRARARSRAAPKRLKAD